MGDLFDGRPIKRVEFGAAPAPTRSTEERYAQQRADREATEKRLKDAEAMWQTVVQAAGGGSGGASAPEVMPMASKVSADGPYCWAGEADDYCY